MLRYFTFGLVAVSVVGWATSASALDEATTAAAKNEGQVTVYTSLILNAVARPLGDAFQKKYGITVNFVRTADATELIRRVIDEAKAGASQCDVIDGIVAAPILRRENLLLQWLPDTARDLPKEYVDKDRYWAALYALVLAPAVNTNLVPDGQQPKSWDDLLDPKWKGKIVWSSLTNTGGPGFVGLALREWGQDKGMEFLRKLSQQKIAAVPASTRVALDQVVAGEYAIAPMSSAQQVFYSKNQGAPVLWDPVNPAAVSLLTASIASKAPHPNAAKLFFEFELSDEGQTVFRDNGYVNTNPRVPPKDAKAVPDGKNFRALFFTPEQIDADMSRWQAIYSDLFH